MEYSWPPHFMITDTDMAHKGYTHTYTHTAAAGAQTSAHTFKLILPATVTNMYTLQKRGEQAE